MTKWKQCMRRELHMDWDSNQLALERSQAGKMDLHAIAEN